jgi:hypothetical protein
MGHHASNNRATWTADHLPGDGLLIEAGDMAYGEMLNLAVWVKSNAGQGSFYRSQHELVGIFRVGEQAHVNNVELGRHGRSRSNVWHYAGINTFRAGRLDELKLHPTVKPVTLVADAVMDCTRRGDIVLDIFCGSGTTILAAERVGTPGLHARDRAPLRGCRDQALASLFKEGCHLRRNWPELRRNHKHARHGRRCGPCAEPCARRRSSWQCVLRALDPMARNSPTIQPSMPVAIAGLRCTADSN